MKRPSISVVMSAYNSGQYIKRAIDSILCSTFSDFELIVVLDAPTDDTATIVSSIARFEPRIRIIEHKENEGAGMARRHGIHTAAGEYFITIDSDDWIEPDFLEALYNEAQRSESDIVSGGVTAHFPKNQTKVFNPGSWSGSGTDAVNKYLSTRVCFMNNKLIRRTLMDGHDYCGRRYIEDMPTIVPLLWRAGKVTYIDNAGYHYPQNPSSLCNSASKLKTTVYRILAMLDIIDYFNFNAPKGTLESIGVLNAIADAVRELNRTPYTDEVLIPIVNDWAEMHVRLHAILKLESFKIIITKPNNEKTDS